MIIFRQNLSNHRQYDHKKTYRRKRSFHFIKQKHYVNRFQLFKTFHENVGKYYVINVVLPSEKLVNADTK